jgi:hypothetical protein
VNDRLSLSWPIDTTVSDTLLECDPRHCCVQSGPGISPMFGVSNAAQVAFVMLGEIDLTAPSDMAT